MKVLILNSVIGEETSTGKHIRDISEYLLQKGEEVLVFYSQKSKVANIPTYAKKFGYSLENKLHALLSRLTGKQGYYSYFGTKSLIRIIEKEKPDIVHLHNLHSNDICFPALFKFLKKRKIKTIINLHDCWYYTGRCYHYTKLNCMQWKNGCQKCPGKCRSSPYWLFKQTKRLARDKRRFFDLNDLRVVGVSKWIAGEAKSSQILGKKKISCIYNWIDMDIFSPRVDASFWAQYGVSDKKIVLGVCGKWVEDKGLSDLLGLSNKLKDNEQLVLIGNVDDSIRESYKDKILFLPPIYNKKNLAQAYANADIYINLSREESFGLTNAEALACGTPIIVYDSTASLEFVNGKCGCIARVGNLEDIVAGVAVLNQLDREELRVECRKFARENFDREKNIKKYYQLYQELI